MEESKNYKTAWNSNQRTNKPIFKQFDLKK